MKYLSVCSGIEAATVAWHGLGWTPVAFSEIDPFASAALATHYPDVPNLGNMEAYREWTLPQFDLLVGGTPCQSFSVAGLRKGLDDPRGNLALVYLGILDRFRPRWCVWENVPGVLSSGRGRDFGAFLGGLAQLGYGFAYRVLDAQYVRVESHPRAVPQRRRRVFVVGHSGGDWRRAAEVLLEPEGVRGNPPTRRKAGEAATGAATRGTRSSVEVAGLLGGAAQSEPSTPVIGFTSRLGTQGGDIYEEVSPTMRIGRGGPITPTVAFSCKDSGSDASVDVTPTLRAMNHAGSHANGGGQLAVAFKASHYTRGKDGAPTMAVRRLTPRECERLQGFPDDHTAIKYKGKPATDTPRYKALGNSMAVNVMRWIGARIADIAARGTLERLDAPVPMLPIDPEIDAR